MPLFAATVFLSAFLLFAVQPMVAKFLLPTFGGTAGVWATCLVVFQTLLLAGYTYAHLLRTLLSPAAQRWTHLTVLAVALLFLPPLPRLAPGAGTSGSPVWELLRCLLVTIGVPFFALSATAPLLMEWFRQAHPGKSPDRLYAFSNAGSLLALLSYPVLLEPNLTRGMQARGWAGGLGVFLVVCAVVAWRTRKGTGEKKSTPHPALSPVEAERVDVSAECGVRSAEQENSTPHTSLSPIKAERVKTSAWLWIALPACGSALLLALTNQISQDVAPMPLLWVGPMAVYLLTFILCFESQRTYRRAWFIPLCFASLLMLAWLLHDGYLRGFWLQVGGYLGVLFLGCMVCHGELYRLRPPPERLTAYYLAISLGGALGGMFVALFAPAVFKTLAETPLIAVAIAALVTLILWQERAEDSIKNEELKFKNCGRVSGSFFNFAFCILHGIPTLIIAVSLGWVAHQQRAESIYFTRNFYGVYRVKESPTLLLYRVNQSPTLLLHHANIPLTPGVARVLLSGQIYHGLQFTNAAAARVATMYFCEESGLGFVFRELPARTNRHIGAVGLGAGTLATYAQPGDRLRIYELNPDVVRIAWQQFTFLSNSAAQVEVVLGDGRLSLEREPDQDFDLLVLDAFAGDSIPLHLLTAEAMQTYRRHLKPDGVMALHISNVHLDLRPVVRALAETQGLTALGVPPQRVDPREGKLVSIWMLLTANREFLQQPAVVAAQAGRINLRQRENLLWTDDYSSILPILK